MTSEISELWDQLVALTTATGDSSLARLLPGRDRAEVASTLSDLMGLEPVDELLDWLTLHDGPAGGAFPPSLAGASWVVTSLDHLLERYRDSRALSIELAPDFNDDESAIWRPEHFPIAVWGSAQLAYDVSGLPRLWAIYPDGGPDQAGTYPGLSEFLELIVRLMETGVYVWDGANWDRASDAVPSELSRMRL